MKKILILFIVLFSASCTERSKIVFEEEYIFPDANWERNIGESNLDFDFQVKDIEKAYSMYLVFSFTEDLKNDEIRFQANLTNDGESRKYFIEEKIRNPKSSDTIFINNNLFFSSLEPYNLNIKNLSTKISNPGFKSIKLIIE